MIEKKVITVEGPDGSGKGTQLILLKEYFQQIGEEAIFTREPGGTVIGEKIRDIILDVNHSEMEDLTEAYLYATSRVQHVKQLFIPNIKKGFQVVSDRFFLSSVCYQGYGRGFDIDLIKQINKPILDILGHDNLVNIILMVPAEIGIARKKGQQALDRLELAGREFHQRVFNGYKAEIQKNEFGNYYEVDATQSVEKVHQDILAILRKTNII